jgi:hypothetical protein
VRIETMADDGLPLVKYGFVGGVANGDGPVVVMLDGELGGNEVDLRSVQLVSITNVELCLAGADLMNEPELRRGLVNLWHAEADTAGLDVDALRPFGDGRAEDDDSWALAELLAGGEHYVVRAFRYPHEPDIVRVRAERPTRSDP